MSSLAFHGEKKMTQREINKKYLNFKTNAIVVDGEVFERDTDNLNMVDWKNFVHVGCELPIEDKDD